MVNNPPPMQKTQVWSLGQEDPLEKKVATHSSILAWEISQTETPGGPQSMGLKIVRHDWATNTFFHFRPFIQNQLFTTPILPPKKAQQNQLFESTECWINITKYMCGFSAWPRKWIIEFKVDPIHISLPACVYLPVCSFQIETERRVWIINPWRSSTGRGRLSLCFLLSTWWRSKLRPKSHTDWSNRERSWTEFHLSQASPLPWHHHPHFLLPRDLKMLLLETH